MNEMVNVYVLKELRENFDRASRLDPKVSGFLRKGYFGNGFPTPQEIIEECRGDYNHQGVRMGNIHVKPLKNLELGLQIPNRFSNAVRLSYNDEREIEKPLGLIYDGTGEDIILGARGFYLTNFVEGVDLIDVLTQMTPRERKITLITMRVPLREWAEKGKYMLDFAPRDIRLRNGKKTEPVFLDTEHVEYTTREIPTSKDAKKIIKEQRKQFVEDYEPFLSEGELSDLLRLWFGN